MIEGKKMKIKNIVKVGRKPVYDITINSDDYNNQQYVLENGIISHNTGSYYGSDNIWIIGRQQEKDDGEIAGYHFVINVEKSRYVKEKSKIPITVSFEGGINRWSGLFDVAVEGKFISATKKGWYALVDQETGEVTEKNFRASDVINNKQFWLDLFKTTKFNQYLESKYKLSHGKILKDEENDE